MSPHAMRAKEGRLPTIRLRYTFAPILKYMVQNYNAQRTTGRPHNLAIVVSRRKEAVVFPRFLSQLGKTGCGGWDARYTLGLGPVSICMQGR